MPAPQAGVQPGQAQAVPQAGNQAPQAPAAAAQPQNQQQNPQQNQAAPAQDARPQPEAVRKIDPRSRESARDREAR
jgi:hypothetical protein